MSKRIVSAFLVIAAAGVGVWALFHFNLVYWQSPPALTSNLDKSEKPDSWADAIEKVKADRGESAGGNVAVETPPELRHYSDRHWFLATQVAEIDKYDVETCQDFVDLAAMIQRREMVTLPAVTESYVLYGVGEKADEQSFSRFRDGKIIEVYNETQLADAYKRLEEKRSSLKKELADLKTQSDLLKRSHKTVRASHRSRPNSREQSLNQELNSTSEEKARLDQFYGQSATRQKLFRDYEALQALAKDLGGRSYDLANDSDRKAFKLSMLSSLRPQALKVLEEVAAVYHNQFDRPLPVSSLVRPEQYQHALNRVNRNAVLIETPPHSTGLAFDIDYRYMSAAEQAFLMAELARLKNQGRIEVIRERNANYHVFAFINGARPSDELIKASLDEAGADVKAAHHPSGNPAKIKSKSQKVRTPRPKARRRK